MTFKRSTVFQWLIAALALVPVILYAYLGQFSRLLVDDYCTIAFGREKGAWDYMVWKLNTWAGGYANWFFKGAMAPLDILVARITPTLIIVLWLVGLSWPVFQALAYLKIDHSRRALSIAIAALAVAASIHAFYSPQSFYWYSPSTQNTLPLALLTIYMALALWTAQRRREDGLSLLGIIAGGLLCFITAGSGEPFVAFQTTFLTLCLLAIFAFLPSSRRRAYLPVFGVGWLATLAGLVIQLSAPGIVLRVEYVVGHIGLPNRAISALVSKTFNWILDFIGNPPAFAGFVMLMAVGLLVMLVKYKPQPISKAAQPVKFALPPLWLGLMFQLLWFPLLWLQTSDSPQWLGRFSGRYMTAAMLNILFILGFLVLIWQRKSFQSQLQKREPGLLMLWYVMASLSIFILLFLLTQIRSIGIDRRSATYLFTSLLMLLVLLTYLLPSAAERNFGFLTLCWYGAGLVCLAAIVFLAEYGLGYVDARILAPGAYLLMLSGLLWGAFWGWLLKHYRLSSQTVQAWIRFLKPASAAAALVIGIGIVLGQAALASDLQLYAREWDVRHQEIIAMRDSGQTAIEVAPLTWNLAEYVGIATAKNLPDCARDYYGVDSLNVVRDG